MAGGQVGRVTDHWPLPDAPEAYGAMITRPMAAPAQSRSADLVSGVLHDLRIGSIQGMGHAT